jgi:hypothetical protein
MRLLVVALTLFLAVARSATANPEYWRYEWPKTDFSKYSVPLEEILSGGPPKDGIPAIDDPTFLPVGEVSELVETEPVIGVVIKGEAKAYPLRILLRHEIVNDELGGIPISVTFCPLCNAAMVFDRRLDGRVLDFGTTGKLRKSDLVMYDRQTESWWQQFLGEGIVGAMTGKRLKIVPARLESWGNFKKRAPNGKVLVPSGLFRTMDTYCCNPYTNYDSQSGPYPFFLQIEMPPGVPAMMRVVSLEDKAEAWTLDLLRKKKVIKLPNGVTLRWTQGQNSALDSSVVAEGRDVGNVTAQRDTPNGPVDVIYFVDFAFAYRAFFPDRPIHFK